MNAGADEWVARYPRLIQLVHSLPGRVRLRLWWLHEDATQATSIADELAAIPGMREVQIRPFTGSVLCQYEPDLLDQERILAVVSQVTGVELVVRPGEEELIEEAELMAFTIEESRLAKAAAAAFKGIDADILRATGGRMDLGMVLALGFVSIGATEIAVTRKVPLPNWFDLAWWAFQAFQALERDALQQAESALQAQRGAAARH